MYFRLTLLNRIVFDLKKLHFHEEVHVLRTLRIMRKRIIVPDWVKYFFYWTWIFKLELEFNKAEDWCVSVSKTIVIGVIYLFESSEFFLILSMETDNFSSSTIEMIGSIFPSPR